MKLTTRSEYALLALTYLGRHKDEGAIALARIAEAQQIPLKYLEQLMSALYRGGYVVSTKGSHGGYRLAKSPEEISLAQVIRLFDGALAPIESVSKYFYKSTPLEKEKKMIEVLRDIRDYIATKLETTTLADLL